MRRLIFALVFAVVVGGAGMVSAASMYVTDSFQITMRTGPGSDNKIVAMLPSGTPLQVIQEGDKWSQVQTANGQQGWVLKQFITPNVPLKTVVAQLQSQNDRLQQTATQATSRAQDLRSKNKKLSSSLTTTEKELAKTQKEFASLQADTQNVVDLRTRYDAARTQLKKTMAEKRALTAENGNLRAGVRLRWFLTGAGVVVGSWLIGLIMGRMQRRKRRSSLY